MEERQKGVVQEEAATFQYTAVEKLIGYEFKDKKLVEEALTHESLFYPLMPEVSYHRLEFMGDAVLSCLVAREVYESYPALDPGHLTRLRAANVDKEKLARIAVNHHLHLYLRHNTTRLPEQIEDFMKAMHEYPIHSNGLLDPPKVLANIVESLLGAIFIDSNSSLDAVWKVFKNLAEPLITPETLGKHPMTELYELCQKWGKQVSIKTDGWTENGKVEVCIDGKLVGSATYVHKKEIAKNRAAKVALDWLQEGKADINLHTPPETSSPD